jgi:cysteinyl-tRNA synthetase
VAGDVERLLAERQKAREAKDFARADAIRDEIAALGYDVKDSPTGATVIPREKFQSVSPKSIANVLDEPAALDFSIHLLYEGFREDLERFLAGLEDRDDSEVVIVDNASDDAEWLESLASEQRPVVHLDTECGYAVARNAGLKTSRGRIVVLADLSIEPAGDILSPLQAVFEDPGVGVAGPFGIVSEDMREFTASDGPEVDAIEGYFLATRRELLAKELIHEKFKWYRHADIDLSFQLKALGTKAVVVDLPVKKHTHRGWAAYTEEERTKRSKKNWNIFFDRWKQHHEILLSHR